MSLGPRVCARLALVLALAPAGAGADEAAPASVELGQTVVRAPRGEAAADPTAAATVVDARRFAGEAKTVAELVSTAPGAAVNGYGGLGQLTTVSIRGSAPSEVQVFLDGLPLGNQAGGGVDLSRIPSQWIERIEVVRGAAGASYGSGAMAGALNVVTRRAAAGSWSAEATGGSFRTFQAAADGALGGPGWALLGAVTGQDTSGRFPYLFDPRQAVGGDAPVERERDHNAATSGGALLKGFADVGEGRLDAALQLSGGRRDLPGSPFRATPGDFQRDARLGLVARLSQPLGEALHLVTGFTARDDRLAVRVEPFAEAHQRDLAATASSALVWSAGPSTLALRGEVGGERLAIEGGVARSRAAGALALSEELALAAGRLRLAAALRLDAEGPFRGVSAKLGGSVRIAGPFSARASAGRGFRSPTFAELYLQQGFLSANPDLVPEESWTADAGLLAEGALGFASIGGFGQLYREVIVYEPDSFRRFKPFNAGKAWAAGLEAEAATAPLGPAALTVSAAYTWLRTETLRGDGAVLGKELPHRAPHRLFARLAGGRGPLELHAEAQWVAAQFQDLRNLVPIPPVFTANLGGAVRLLSRPDLKLHLEVRNLLDDRSLQDGFGNPLPGRMVLLTLRVAGRKDSP